MGLTLRCGDRYVSMSYSSFHHFRTAVAVFAVMAGDSDFTEIGYEVAEDVPLNSLRIDDRSPTGIDVCWEAINEAAKNMERANADDHALLALLYHSDCDYIWSPGQCLDMMLWWDKVIGHQTLCTQVQHSDPAWINELGARVRALWGVSVETLQPILFR